MNRSRRADRGGGGGSAPAGGSGGGRSPEETLSALQAALKGISIPGMTNDDHSAVRKAYGAGGVVEVPNAKGNPLAFFLRSPKQTFEEAGVDFLRHHRGIKEPGAQDVATLRAEMLEAIPAVRESLQAPLGLDDSALLDELISRQSLTKQYLYRDRMGNMDRVLELARDKPEIADAIMKQMGRDGVTVTAGDPGWADAPVELFQGVPVAEGITNQQAAMTGAGLGGAGAAFLLDYLFDRDQQPVVVSSGGMR